MKIGAKNGVAEIEIELKGAANKRNVTIRRVFQATDKSSAFYINDKPSSQKEVTERVRTLNVQVDNLWYEHSLRLRLDNNKKLTYNA